MFDYNKRYIYLSTPQNGQYENVIQLVRDVLRRHNIELLTISDVDTGDDVKLSVKRLIEQSSLVIAEISDLNPNVMYEVGIGQGLNRLIMPLVRQDVKTIPVDLALFWTVIYDPSDLRQLPRLIERWLDTYLQDKREAV